jgi:hypothetical protein
MCNLHKFAIPGWPTVAALLPKLISGALRVKCGTVFGGAGKMSSTVTHVGLAAHVVHAQSSHHFCPTLPLCRPLQS